MGLRQALVIGNSEYADDRLSRLQKPGADAAALARVLRDPAIGCFDGVTLLLNESAMAARKAIARMFSRKKSDDLLLLFFSGHGLKDARGYLYLAFRDTEQDLLSATAISAEFITGEMNATRSRRQVLILDCCYSGAFDRSGNKAGAGLSAGIAEVFEGNGFGRVVLTATDAVQFAWEHDRTIDKIENSVFTHHLIRGLESGAADLNRDGIIGLGELYEYVYEKVVQLTPRQTPRKWSYKQQGEILIAFNPKLRAAADPRRRGLAHRQRRERRDLASATRAEARRIVQAPSNPFAATLAIRDPSLFIGRREELRQLRSMLRGGSVAVTGDHKIGKSSLLWRLAEDWPGEVLGPLDLQAIADREDFYDSLAGAMGLTGGGWRRLRRVLKERRLLLLLDEVDAGPEWGMSNEDLGRLRAISSQNPGFKLAVVSRTALKEVFPDSGRGSPAYNFLQPLKVAEMREGEARSLLAHPWAPEAQAFDAHTIERILALAGRHPFKVQRAAFHCYRALIDDPEHDWQAAWRRDLEQML